MADILLSGDGDCEGEYYCRRVVVVEFVGKVVINACLQLNEAFIWLEQTHSYSPANEGP